MKTAFLDMEVYPNFVFCAAMYEDGTRFGWTSTDPTKPLSDIPSLRAFVTSHTLVTFNGTGFDLPLLMLIMRQEPAKKIKEASDRIIQTNLKWWNFEDVYHVKVKRDDIDHIDLMEVAPLRGSLKLYAAKCHSRSVQDLPYPPGEKLTAQQIEVVTEYCYNDLSSTRDLYNRLKTAIGLRTEMGKMYGGMDLRSKSDAQMAEAIIKHEVEKLKCLKVYKPHDLTGSTFKYRVPSWMYFNEIDLLEDVSKAEFMVSDTGKTIIPPALEGRKIELRGKTYKLGAGGLHSGETKQIRRANTTHFLADFDVASYYPAIVLNLGLYPAHLGKEFLTVYKGLVDKRLAAKKRAQDLKKRLKAERTSDLEAALRHELVWVEGLKIAINGTFGKLGNKYSVLYSPDLMLQVTITGQLALLMLIEKFIDIPGVEVISANTDGVTIYAERTAESSVTEAVTDWERETQFVTERTNYEAVYARDVNNYVAITLDRDVKTKGAYGKGLPLHKNPVAEICGDAVVDHLLFGFDVEDTIRLCDDIRKFLCVRTVKGGGKWREEAIGKVVRWYFSVDSTDAIHYCVNDNLVPTTGDGVVPLINLPERLPSDLNYDWYIREAQSMLTNLGVMV